MMNSGFGGGGDDDFGPNPFRTTPTNGFGQQQPQQQQQFQQQGYPPQQQYPAQQPTYAQQQQQQYPPQQQQQQFQPQQSYYGQQQQPVQQQQFYQPNGGMQPGLMPNPTQYLTGTMDQNATTLPGANNYGATREIPSTPFSIFSWRGLLACMALDTYQQYFDVDTVDITDRLKGSVLKFYEPDQFRTAVLGDTTTYEIPATPIDPNLPHNPSLPPLPPASPPSSGNAPVTITAGTRKGPDLYGPLWISMTLIFVLGVTSNLSAYFHHQKHVRHAGATEQIDDFEYDITHLIRAGSIVFTFDFIVPTTFWLLTHCLGIPALPWAMWMCCYGYSAVPISIGAMVAWWFPYSLWHWLVLAAATFVSGLLIVRNLSTPLLSQDTATHAKAAPLILAILGTHFVYMCVLKFTFFTHKY